MLNCDLILQKLVFSPTDASLNRHELEKQLYDIVHAAFFKGEIFALLDTYKSNDPAYFLILINIEKILIKNNKGIQTNDYENLLNSFLSFFRANFHRQFYIRNKILDIFNLLIYYSNNLSFLSRVFNNLLFYNLNSVTSFEDKLLLLFQPGSAGTSESLIDYNLNFSIIKNFVDFLLLNKSKKKFLVTDFIAQLSSAGFFTNYTTFLLYEFYYFFYLFFNEILQKNGTNVSLILPNYEQLRLDLQNTIQAASNNLGALLQGRSQVSIMDFVPKEIFGGLSMLAHASLDLQDFSAINSTQFNALNFAYLKDLVDSARSLVNHNFGYIFVNFELFSFFFLYMNVYSSVIISNFNTTSSQSLKTSEEIFNSILEIFSDILSRKTLVLTSTTSQYYNISSSISNILLTKLNSYGTLAVSPLNLKSEKFVSLSMLSNGNLSMLSPVVSSSLQQTITSCSNSSTNFLYYFLIKKYLQIIESLDRHHLIFYNNFDHTFYDNFVNYFNLTFDFINLFISNFLEKILSLNFSLFNLSFSNLLLNFFMVLFNFTCKIKLPSILTKLLSLWKKIYYNDNIKMFLFSNTNINEKLSMHLLYCTLLNYNKHMNELRDDINDELTLYLYGDPHIKEIVSNLLSLKVFLGTEKGDRLKVVDQVYGIEEVNSEGILIRNEIFEIFTYMIDISGLSQQLLDETNKLIKTLIEEDKNFLMNNSKVLDLIYLLKLLPLCTNSIMNSVNTIELVNKLVCLQNDFVSYIIINYNTGHINLKLDVISLIVNINQCVGQLLQANTSLITLESEELYSTGCISALNSSNTSNIWANVGDLLINTLGNLMSGIFSLNNWAVDLKEFSLSFFILLTQTLTIFSPYLNTNRPVNSSISSNLINIYGEKYSILKNNLVGLLQMILPDISLFNSNSYNLSYSIDILSLVVLCQEILLPNQISSQIVSNFNDLINFFSSQFEGYLNHANNNSPVSFISTLNSSNLSYYNNTNNVLYEILKKLYYYINFLNILIKNSNIYNNNNSKANLVAIINQLSSNFLSILYILMNLQSEYWQHFVFLKFNLCSCSLHSSACNCTNKVIHNFQSLLELNSACLKSYLIFSTNLLQCLGKKNYSKLSLETLEKYLSFIFLSLDYNKYKENPLISFYSATQMNSSSSIATSLVASNSNIPIPYNFLNFSSPVYLPLIENLNDSQRNILKASNMEVLFNSSRPSNPLVLSLFSSESGGISLILLILDLIKTQAESTASNSAAVPHLVQLIHRFYSSLLPFFGDEKICSELLQSTLNTGIISVQRYWRSPPRLIGEVSLQSAQQPGENVSSLVSLLATLCVGSLGTNVPPQDTALALEGLINLGEQKEMFSLKWFQETIWAILFRPTISAIILNLHSTHEVALFRLFELLYTSKIDYLNKNFSGDPLDEKMREYWSFISSELVSVASDAGCDQDIQSYIFELTSKIKSVKDCRSVTDFHLHFVDPIVALISSSY